MNHSNETIYSDLSASKWLFKIEQIFCPQKHSDHLYSSKLQTEFLEMLHARRIDFYSSFTEIIGTSAKRAKISISQLIMTSNKVHVYFLNLSKIKVPTEIRNGLRKNYLQILSIIESLLDDCEKLNEKLLRELPLTFFSSFEQKGKFKKKLETLRIMLYKSSLASDLIELIISGLKYVIEKTEVKRAEMKYAFIIVDKLLKNEGNNFESIEDSLIQFDFNSPKFFNYCAKKCNAMTIEYDSLHYQLELLIGLEDRLNSLPQLCSARLKIEDDSIKQQLKSFYREKKENIKQKIELRRNEILDARLWEDNERQQINLPVPQLSLFIRVFMERGIIPKEDIGKTFSYYAKHFRTPQTPFISAESLQKKSTDVEFATAKKMKGHLIGMINWLNENYNTSNYSDS